MSPPAVLVRQILTTQPFGSFLVHCQAPSPLEEHSCKAGLGCENSDGTVFLLFSAEFLLTPTFSLPGVLCCA